jgi:hypothetical protein
MAEAHAAERQRELSSSRRKSGQTALFTPQIEPRYTLSPGKTKIGSSEQRDDWQPAQGFSSGSVPKPRSSVAKWRPSVRVGLDLWRVNKVAAKQRQKRRNIPCVKPNLGQSLKNATIVAPSVVAHPCQIITSICPGGSMCVFKWRSDSPQQGGGRQDGRMGPRPCAIPGSGSRPKCIKRQ